MDCIFCKIVQGSIPCYKVYEDPLFFGFLDILPLSKGNTLLIPKTHYRWVNNVPEFGKYWEAAHHIGKRIELVFGAQSTSYLTLGEEVPHAHIRIIPRYKHEELYLSLKPPQKYSPEQMAEIARSLT